MYNMRFLCVYLQALKTHKNLLSHVHVNLKLGQHVHKQVTGR